MSVHVAFVTPEYPPFPSGGIGSSVRTLGRALVRRGHRVTVVGWGPERHEDDEGVAVRFRPLPRLRGAGRWLLWRFLQRELGRLAREESLAVVETPDWCGFGAGLRLPVPVVVRCHGSARFFARHTGARVRPSVALAERMALRGAAGLAAVSRYAARVTRDCFGLARPIAVIPNGVDLARFHAPVRGEPEPGLVVHVGTIVRKKGAFDLGPVFSRVVARHPSARLIVIGRDAPDDATGAPSTWRACLAGFSPAALRRTEYLGEQAPEAVQAHVRRAAACLFPSHAETLGIAWLEAMACARPIVAWDLGWAREVVEHGATGALVPAGDVAAAADALAGLLEDEGRAAAWGCAGRRRVERVFSDAVVAERTEAWHADCLAAWGRR